MGLSKSTNKAPGKFCLRFKYKRNKQQIAYGYVMSNFLQNNILRKINTKRSEISVFRYAQVVERVQRDGLSRTFVTGSAIQLMIKSYPDWFYRKVTRNLKQPTLQLYISYIIIPNAETTSD